MYICIIILLLIFCTKPQYPLFIQAHHKKVLYVEMFPAKLLLYSQDRQHQICKMDLIFSTKIIELNKIL